MRASSSFSSAAAALAAALALSSTTTSTGVMAQSSTGSASCLSLKGSSQCPSFQDAWVNPQNLSTAWPWFSAVTDVQSFDEQFSLYFSDPTRFTATKFNKQLQCNRTGAQNATLQYQRTILCGEFSQISYSAGCNRDNRADAIMVCQDTCLQYAGTEAALVANPQVRNAHALAFL